MNLYDLILFKHIANYTDAHEPPAGAEWLTGYLYRKRVILTGGASGDQINFQINLGIDHVTGKMESDFEDIRFTSDDGVTLIDAWLESYIDGTSAEVWVKFPITPETSDEKIYFMYYGKTDAVNYWDGEATFLQYHGSATTEFQDSLVQKIPYIYHAKVKRINADAQIYFGMSDAVAHNAANHLQIQHRSDGAGINGEASKASTTTGDTVAGVWTIDTWYNIKIVAKNADLVEYYTHDDINKTTEIATSANIPIVMMGLKYKPLLGAGAQDWSFIRKYAANPPTYEFGVEETL